MNYHSGNLTHWATQGVFLLNTTLTVQQGKPLSHRHLPYAPFISDVLHVLNHHPHPLIFLLWGRHAQSYAPSIDKRHMVLTANHPSPLSANQGGWFGCRHFSKTNQWLIEQGYQPIRWQNNILI
jgi:uracil-DNA glycosylase